MTSTEDWLNWHEDQTTTTTTTPAPTPATPVSTIEPQVIYENYDTKYNVYDDDPDPKSPTQNNHDDRITLSNTAPSTILVIGIIVVAVIAIILIVVIVLKTRTRVDGDFKVDDSR